MNTFDLSVMKLPTTELRVVETGLTANGQALLTGGLAKLSQTVLILFTTDAGSVAFNSDLGASPIPELRRINLMNPETVDQILSSSASSIQRQIEREYEADTPLDERIGTLRISARDISVESATIFVVIELSSVVGDAAEYPITVGIN